MKKRAILYTRVSTDEQNNGFSPVDQKDKLYRYCENNNIEIVGFFHDDASGKSFERPEWRRIMEFIKMHKGSVDCICFIRWDRFSRNTQEAYAMLQRLWKQGLEAMAIEQPINFTIPEQKLMLAIYLASPEVDNDRRSLNVYNGMRKAKKAGHWMGGCLRGYRIVRDQNNKTTMIPEGGEKERLVKKAFSEFATGGYAIEELRKKMAKEGLKISRSAFWVMLRNRGYIGEVFVAGSKDESEEWIKGKHASLVDEKTFLTVQRNLKSRKKIGPAKMKTLREEFPLRGHLICARCGKILTGSFSRGQMGKKYAYYHCLDGCKERIKAEEVNSSFEEIMMDIHFPAGVKSLFKKIVKEKLSARFSDTNTDRAQTEKKMEKLQQRKRNAQALLLDGEISPNEYKEMNESIEEELSRLQNEIATMGNPTTDITRKMDDCLKVIEDLKHYYNEKGLETKHRLIRSIFPEKLIFDKKAVRTFQVNKVISLMASIDKGFQRQQKRKHTGFGVLSCGVVPTGPYFNVLYYLS
ncbi:MAG: recombinase family protein [Bacteroidia bacterium]|nr:recombinase family protein [Bacteroidia bacterium]